MADFILMMHGDAPGEEGDWDGYLGRLGAAGKLRGGSAIGGGRCFRKDGAERAITSALVGFIRIEASDVAEAETLLAGNPVYEAGGTVEIRELPVTG